MPDQQEQFVSFLEFIKEHRGDERHFEKLYNKLDEVIQMLGKDKQVSNGYLSKLSEIKEKQAKAYIQAKEKAGTAWPEFENFVSEMEKATTASLKE